MPIYEYQCKKCEDVFEVLQKISDPPPKKCPACGSKRVGRVLSESSFVLKGGGWYETDYSDIGKNKKEGRDAEKKSTESSGSSDKKKDKKDKSKKKKKVS